jgi:phosphotransferase system  glucose/maltose/N-acetylglucosamine-specific IIC component
VSLAAEGGAIAIHDDQGRIAARQIYRLVDILTMVTASTSAVSPIKNDALASLIMDSVYHARSTISEVDSSGMTTGVILQQIQLFTRIICLAEVWLNAWPATSGTLGQIIAWLLVPTLGLAGKADLSFRSDVLAWLLQGA